MDTLYNIVSIIGGLVLLGCFIWFALNAGKPTNSEYLKQVDEIVKESKRLRK